jgi:hypothetical protein
MSAVTKNSIPLDLAVTVTSNWRKYYSDNWNIGDPNSPQIFRGFTVPISDLLNLVDLYKAANLDIDGIRIYLAKGEIKDGDPPVMGGDPDLIHVLLVPITGANSLDDSSVIPIYPLTHDVLQDKAGQSTIYDFTAPCPYICDNLSLLFSPQPTT